MSAESPAEYIECLRAENKALRRGLLEAVREKQQLEAVIARQSVRIVMHEAARPGLDEVD